MAALYADENVTNWIVIPLRNAGHDVLTAFEDGRANLGIEDSDVLDRAHELQRTLITNNRLHFHRLHRQQPGHSGIITYTEDQDSDALAARIDAAIQQHSSLAGQLIRVIRPSR